jgi:bisphosphoglycerate-independent phosphoglycerate mutase (AlkP superfamily)
MKRERPRVIFIGFDETDEHGHGGRYDEYLKSAHKADRLIGELWAYIQSDPFYRDQTTLLITTDHGRGKGRNSWRKHQLLSPGSGQIWFAVLGPDTPAFGEMKFRSKYYQKQVASTVAAFLGLPYKQKEPVGEVIQTMLAVPGLDLDRTLSKNNVTGSLNEQ